MALPSEELALATLQRGTAEQPVYTTELQWVMARPAYVGYLNHVHGRDLEDGHWVETCLKNRFGRRCGQ